MRTALDMHRDGVQLKTERLHLRLVGVEDAAALAEFARRNREQHGPWEPLRKEDYFGEAWWHQHLSELAEDVRAGHAAQFAGFLADGGELVLRANLSNFIRGAFQAAFLGFALDSSYEGQGLAFEGVGAVVRFGFEELNLHRIMANHRPENVRSGALLTRLGFVQEGYAVDYLRIDGAWRDHVMTVRTNSDWQPSD